jgi:hypothetical protein
MVYFFADELDANPDYAINAKREPMPKVEVRRPNKQLPKRPNGRSKGLLEVATVENESGYFRFEVNFLHRTVRDFLYSSPEVHEMFKTSIPDTFDAWETLCQAYVAFLKCSSSWDSAKHSTSPK